MDTNTNTLLKVIKLSAQIILENGGETYRAEETIKFICKTFNVKEIDSIATPTGFYLTVSLDGEDHHTIVKRIRNRTINLQKITDVNNISRHIASHSISLEDALIELEMIKNNNASSKYSMFYTGISSAFFTVLFGGKVFEFIVALIIGIIITIISRMFQDLHSYQFFSSIISGAILTLIAVVATSLSGIGSYNYIIVGSIMPLLPGLAMTNAIRDTIRGDLISGIARAAEALLVASSLAAGAGLVFYMAYAIGFLVI